MGMTDARKWQTSYDRTHWQEFVADESLRDAVGITTTPTLMRSLYPLRARLRKEDRTHRLPAGTTFHYARTRLRPSIYPIEVHTIGIQGHVGGQPRISRLYYSSAEIELLTAE